MTEGALLTLTNSAIEPIGNGEQLAPAAKTRSHSIQIRKGVPLPEKKGKPNKYPFRFMQVGDFFFIAPKNAKRIRYVQHLVSAAGMQFAKKNAGCESWKFATRQMIEDGVRGVGVWRLA